MTKIVYVVQSEKTVSEIQNMANMRDSGFVNFERINTFSDSIKTHVDTSLLDKITMSALFLLMSSILDYKDSIFVSAMELDDEGMGYLDMFISENKCQKVIVN